MVYLFSGFLVVRSDIFEEISIVEEMFILYVENRKIIIFRKFEIKYEYECILCILK